MRQHFTVLGSARALPAEALGSDELDSRLGLPAGWTARHTGVLRRHRNSGPAETEALTRRVSLAALEEAGLALRDLDLIIDASLSLQQPIPCNAAPCNAASAPGPAASPAWTCTPAASAS